MKESRKEKTQGVRDVRKLAGDWWLHENPSHISQWPTHTHTTDPHTHCWDVYYQCLLATSVTERHLAGIKRVRRIIRNGALVKYSNFESIDLWSGMCKKLRKLTFIFYEHFSDGGQSLPTSVLSTANRYPTAWAWVTTICCVSPAPRHFFLKKEPKQKEVESPLSLKKQRRAWEDRVGETNIRNKEEKERGEDVCRSGGWKEWEGDNRDALRWWLMVFVEKETHLGGFFPWHCETMASDDSAKCLCALSIFWLVYLYETTAPG